MANNHVIGKDNKMPWHLPAELQHFKKTTRIPRLLADRLVLEPTALGIENTSAGSALRQFLKHIQRHQ